MIATLRASIQENRGIAAGVWWNVLLLLASLAALLLDHRLILGLNPWIKPLKFEISVIIFLLTAGLILHALGRTGAWRRTRAVLGWGFGICMIVENTIIALQSARGVRSHMNFTTPKDALLFAVMGVFIALNTVLAAWLLALWLVAKTGLRPAIVWGVQLGLLMLLVASAEGVRIIANGGHTVGAIDGGEGLPFINWSRHHGDLRIAHFVALHCLQLFPLAGIALTRTRLGDRAQVLLLFLFAALTTTGVWWLFAQAMRGLPAF